jgi:UrcA family protein
MTRKLTFATAAITGFAICVAGAAQAGETTVTVNRSALSDPAYIEALYKEIRSVASKVCRTELYGSVVAIYAMNECVKEAADTAIAEIDAPMLTAYGNGEPDALAVASAD